MHGHAGRSLDGDRHGVAHVVEMPVRHEHHVARLDLIGGLRAVRVCEERVQDEGLATR